MSKKQLRSRSRPGKYRRELMKDLSEQNISGAAFDSLTSIPYRLTLQHLLDVLSKGDSDATTLLVGDGWVTDTDESDDQDTLQYSPSNTTITTNFTPSPKESEVFTFPTSIVKTKDKRTSTTSTSTSPIPVAYKEKIQKYDNTSDLTAIAIDEVFALLYSTLDIIPFKKVVKELYSRGWKYFEDKKRWIRKRSKSEMIRWSPSIGLIYYSDKSWKETLLKEVHIDDALTMSVYLAKYC